MLKNNAAPLAVVVLIALAAGILAWGLCLNPSRRALAADGNDYKAVYSGATDWRINKTSGALLVEGEYDGNALGQLARANALLAQAIAESNAVSKNTRGDGNISLRLAAIEAQLVLLNAGTALIVTDPNLAGQLAQVQIATMLEANQISQRVYQLTFEANAAQGRLIQLTFEANAAQGRLVQISADGNGMHSDVVSLRVDANGRYQALLSMQRQLMDPNLVPGAIAARNRDYVVTEVRRVWVQKTSMLLSDANVGGPNPWPGDLAGVGWTKADSNMPDARLRISYTVDGNFPVVPAGGVLPLSIRMAEANEIRVICPEANSAYDLWIYRPRN